MITDVRLRAFRSYHDATFEFESGVNIIVGPNASGKTNLLEAILIVCRGSSYRAKDQQLIEHGKSWATITAHNDGHERLFKLQLEGDVVKKEFHIDGTVLRRLMANRRLPVVMFEPSHLQLLTESPEKRRAFLDDIIEQIDPGFEKARREYKRILAQRNTLLKSSASLDQLFVWDIRLSDTGARIASARKAFVATHSQQLGDLYATLSQKPQQAALRYDSMIQTSNYAEGMLTALKARTSLDKERGFTSVGPHRDDIVPMLDGHELMKTGSRGEVRTTLLALKILELSVLEEALDIKPILLLDDVFSELDGARRRALTAYLQDHQTFITTTDADIVVQHFMDNCHVIPTQ